MNLFTLRALVKEYEQTWYVRQYFYGDHAEIIQIRRYLKAFQDKPDDYQLISSDFFKLIKIISAPSQLSMIQSLKPQIQMKEFFEVFKTGVVNENNFSIVFSLQPPIIMILYNIYYRYFIPARLRQTVLETILTLHHERGNSPEIINTCFILLWKNRLLDENSLHFLKKYPSLDVVVLIMKELDKAKQLNEINLTLLPKEEFIRHLADLLFLLNETKISIKSNLFKAICNNDSLDKILEISRLLCAPTIQGLSKDSFSRLLNKNSLALFEKIISLLSSKNISEKVEIKLKKLLKDPSQYKKLYRLLAYFDRSQLLAYDILHEFLSKEYNQTSPLFKLFENMRILKLNISGEHFKALLLLSNPNLKRLNELLTTLAIVKKLNPFSFEQALQRVSIKIPDANESTVEKNSRKNSGLPRSEMTIDSKIRFFMEHSEEKSYEGGNYGTVKKGYDTLDGNTPLYGIKKFRKNNEHQARREVRFHRLLGRNAFWVKRADKTYMVSEWQHGKALTYFEPNELMQVSLEQRLKCLFSALGELDSLHAHHCVHGDIKCQNSILNLQEGRMTLIDFGGSHKQGAVKHLIWTASYHEKSFNTDNYSFCDDVYAMGVVAAELVPEIYTVTLGFGKTSTRIELIKKSDLTTVEQALVMLVNTMTETDRDKRCTSGNALQYCQALLQNFEDLNDALLQQIRDSTLNPVTVAMEDAFRGSFRGGMQATL